MCKNVVSIQWIRLATLIRIDSYNENAIDCRGFGSITEFAWLVCDQNNLLHPLKSKLLTAEKKCHSIILNFWYQIATNTAKPIVHGRNWIVLLLVCHKLYFDLGFVLHDSIVLLVDLMMECITGQK